MQIPKPGEDDKEFFRSILPEDPEVEVKPMFGNLGAFVNGNMFMGLFGSDVGIKLPEDDQQQLLAEVWGPGYARANGNLRLYVAQLRRKLEPDPARPRWLLTEPGMGYRFQPGPPAE